MPFIAAACFLESNHFPLPVPQAQLVFLRSYMLPCAFPKNSLYPPVSLTEVKRAAVMDTLGQAARSRRFLILTIGDSNLNR